MHTIPGSSRQPWMRKAPSCLARSAVGCLDRALARRPTFQWGRRPADIPEGETDEERLADRRRSRCIMRGPPAPALLPPTRAPCMLYWFRGLAIGSPLRCSAMSTARAGARVAKSKQGRQRHRRHCIKNHQTIRNRRGSKAHGRGRLHASVESHRQSQIKNDAGHQDDRRDNMMAPRRARDSPNNCHIFHRRYWLPQTR